MNQQATLSSSLLAKFPVLEKVRALPKPVLLGAAAAVVALIVAAVMWSSEPKYRSCSRTWRTATAAPS